MTSRVLHPQVDAGLRSFLWREAGISTLMNGLVPGLAVYFTYQPLPIAAWGADGFVVFVWRMIPVVSFGMAFIMTAVMRARQRKGGVPGLPLPAAAFPWLRWLPRKLWQRALLMLALACVLLVPFSALVGALLPAELGRVGFSAYVFFIGACIGALVTPPVMLSAFRPEQLSDGRVA